MNIIVFDTETTSLDKPFCYNVGYVIYDTEQGAVLTSKEYVVEQIWHNLPLFSTAYYANKRKFYVKEMRARRIKLEKFGYICQSMIRDIKNYQVVSAYAYNSSFDEKVFSFNCDWFKCNNPFDNIPIFDIRGFVHNSLIGKDYKTFCDNHGYYTESGNYSTTAETVYRFITQNTDFVENHTALDDALIETDILLLCIRCGLDLLTNYKSKRTIPRVIEKTLTIDNKGEKIEIKCNGYTFYHKKDLIKIK